MAREGGGAPPEAVPVPGQAVTPFGEALWIGKRYRFFAHRRRRDRTILHFPRAHVRRTVDKLLGRLGFVNRDFLPAPHFRKVVRVAGPRAGSVAITGLGYFELYVNGCKVGDDVLSPPYSQYEERVYFLTYEIGPYLREGENVFAVILGDGMYNVHLRNAWNYDTAHWRGLPKFILKGSIEGEERVEFESDGSWKVAFGPILSTDIYGGETYDARKELGAWLEPDFDDSAWETAVSCPSPTRELDFLPMAPARVLGELEPVSFWKTPEGPWIFDLGLNVSGVARLRAAAPAGTIATLTYSEKLLDGRLDLRGHHEHTAPADRHLIQKDRYVFKGQGLEEWQARFTYHGFQYVEVEGLPEVDRGTVLGKTIHSDLRRRGDFACSNELLNRVFAACDRSNLNNFQGLPTDCPHREKNGWTGDVHLSIDYNLLSFDCEGIFRKWIRDLSDVQNRSGQIPAIAPTPGWGYNWITGPAWDSALILIPWSIYLYRGELGILEESYEAMRSYLRWQIKRTRNLIVTYGLGDWCSPGRPANKPECPPALTGTAYNHRSARVMARIAEALGRKNEAEEYRELAAAIGRAFVRRFVDLESGLVVGDCQTSYAAVLYFGLVEGDLAERVFERLVEKVEESGQHLDTGILGTSYLLEVLSARGRGDLAYRIATQRDFPSWGFWIEQGATTLWENWNGEASRNHRMFGSIASWFYRHLAGIQADEEAPGLRHVVIKPDFRNDMASVTARTETPHGELSVAWRREAGFLELRVQAPEAVAVTVQLDEGESCAVAAPPHCRIEIIAKCWPDSNREASESLDRASRA